jgi:hypothetical protein
MKIHQSSGKASTPELEIERRRKISDSMKKNPLAGGKRHGSGRGKKGWYKGYWCDSSWELAWVIYHIDHDIVFARNTTPFAYVFDGKVRYYYPDFIIDNIYHEIKGRRSYSDLDAITQQKISQFSGGQLIVLYSNHMKPILNYVEDLYGKDFVKLYENELHTKDVKSKIKECIPIHKPYNKRQLKYCECGKVISHRHIRCADCYHLQKRRVERPSYVQLLNEIKEVGYCGTGRKYGVSDNAIRKWKIRMEEELGGAGTDLENRGSM